jgi:ATP/maltotriose-dependent transcriptional regulator MalT
MGSREKFSPPAFNLALVQRRRLVEAVAASMADNTVTLIVAPTGSGKSALLVQAMEAWTASGGEAAWFACDHFDAEGGRFLSMFEQALPGGPGADDGGGDRSAIEALLSAHDPKGVADAIVARGRRVAVVIDNLHLCDSPEVADALDVLIRESRGLLHLVIGSRRQPRLTLGHLRLRGLVREFDAADLAFSPDEARDLIGCDCRADADAVERVIQRTEGWAAGLQLVRLLVQSGASLRQLAEGFSGADQDVGQFLNEEVFRTVPPPLQSFLLKVAILDCISADLSEAVTADPEAHRHFLEMQERNLFVTRLDRQGTQVRLHAMFRDFLTMQGARRDPALAGRCLRRAAVWHHDKGDWIEAIDYAFRAGDLKLAAAWLEACAAELLTRRGETARFLTCAERLSESGHVSPGITFWRIWATLFSGDYDRASGMMDEHLEVLQRHDPKGSQLGQLQFMVAFFAHRHAEALALGRQWLDSDPESTPFDRASVLLGMALCQRTQLDMASAMKCCELARQEIAPAPTNYGLAWMATLVAHFMLLQGRPVAAAKEIEDMLAQHPPTALMRGTAELVLAEAYYERGLFDQARLLIRRSLPTIALHGSIDVALCGWRVAARLAVHERGAAAALDLLREVEPLSIRRFGMAALRMLHLLRAEIILDLDPEVRRSLEIGPAADGADALPVSDTPETAEWQRLLSAKRNLVSGHPRRAIADVLPVLAATRVGGRLRLWVQASCVKAAAHRADGEPTFALRTLMEAIEQAAAHGMVRSIADQQAILRPLAPAIAQYVRSAQGTLTPEVLALAGQLAGTLPGAAADDDAATEDEPAVEARLSKKEYRVLAMVSQGMTNGQITERLFVSLPTVKWHLRNIFEKLDVRTRTAAVAKARSLGMLQ